MDRWESDFVDFLWSAKYQNNPKLGPDKKMELYGLAIGQELKKFLCLSKRKSNFFMESGKAYVRLGGYDTFTAEIPFLDLDSMVGKLKSRAQTLNPSVNESYYQAVLDLKDKIVLQLQEVNSTLNFDISMTLVDRNRKAKNFIQMPSYIQDDPKEPQRTASGIDYCKLAVGDPMYMLAQSLSDPFVYLYFEKQKISIDDFARDRIHNYVSILSAEHDVVCGREKVTEESLFGLYRLWSIFVTTYDSVAYGIRDNGKARLIQSSGGNISIDDSQSARDYATVLSRIGSLGGLLDLTAFSPIIPNERAEDYLGGVYSL